MFLFKLSLKIFNSFFNLSVFSSFFFLPFCRMGFCFHRVIISIARSSCSFKSSFAFLFLSLKELSLFFSLFLLEFNYLFFPESRFNNKAFNFFSKSHSLQFNLQNFFFLDFFYFSTLIIRHNVF